MKTIVIIIMWVVSGILILVPVSAVFATGMILSKFFGAMADIADDIGCKFDQFWRTHS